jgi:hypothetical protein
MQTPRDRPGANKFWNYVPSPRKLFGAVTGTVKGLFTPVKPITTSVVTNDRSSKRREIDIRRGREETPAFPGAWIESASSANFSVTSTNRGRQSIQPRVVSRDLHRDRNDQKYWNSVANEIVGGTIEPRLQNLPPPNPHAPRRPLPKATRPLHRSPQLFNSARKSEFGRHDREDATQNLRMSFGSKGARASEGSKHANAESKEPLPGVELEPELANFLGALDFRRSEKLQRKAQTLRDRKAPSPGLQDALDKALQDYREKKRREEEERLKPKEPEPPRLLIIPLPEDVVQSLPNLAKIPAGKEMNMFGRTPITARDLLTLRPDVWLNDEIMNSWLWELCDKAKSILAKQMEENGTPIKDDTPRYHAFNTQWYPTMAKPDWKSKVPRWAKRAKVDGANLLKVHKILIPLHQGNHWTLLVILPQRRLVRYYNSLRGDAGPYLQAGKDWISHELGGAWNEDEWQFEHAQSGQQLNGSDCGVFASCNALATFYTDFLPDVLPTGEMVDARDFMKFILINGGFSGQYNLPVLHPDFRLETDRSVKSTSDKGKEKAK